MPNFMVHAACLLCHWASSLPTQRELLLPIPGDHSINQSIDRLHYSSILLVMSEDLLDCVSPCLSLSLTDLDHLSSSLVASRSLVLSLKIGADMQQP